MRRHFHRFMVYRDAKGWYVSREDWPIDVQMFRYTTRKKALNSLLAFQRDMFAPWCLPEDDRDG